MANTTQCKECGARLSRARASIGLCSLACVRKYNEGWSAAEMADAKVEAANMTQALGARKDAHARKQGDLVLRNHVVVIDSAQAVFEFVSNLDSRFFRVIYRCQDGRVRDIIGRQGVWNSRQDGEVQGIGHSMRNAARLNLSFWTATFGGKVNTGTGKGYRTLRAEGILVLRVKDANGQDTDIVTGAGMAALQRAALD